MEYKKCPYCNMDLRNNKTCSYCGHNEEEIKEERIKEERISLQFYEDMLESEDFNRQKTEEKFCSYCNIKLDQDAKFCKLCGRGINKSRYISKAVQREVWRRDMGRCVECGSKELLEYDHIIPFSRGGSSTVRNIQLLCERCNRSKNNNI